MKICKLYLQLLYRCNFNCEHCFHGERLLLSDNFSFEEAYRVMNVFKDEYGIDTVVLLGGEPFLYKSIIEVIGFAKQLGLRVDICTNGYRIGKQLAGSADKIDNLRVSLEGLEDTNDRIRHIGSFRAAVETLDIARSLGVHTSVTMTVNSRNICEVMSLTQLVANHGAREMKLHCLRPIGNVVNNRDLMILDQNVYVDLVHQIKKSQGSSTIPILFDEDLDPQCSLVESNSRIQDELERIEIQPSGELYVSCKAVGADSNAFIYDKKTGRISYQPKANNEIDLHVPQVHYSKL